MLEKFALPLTLQARPLNLRYLAQRPNFASPLHNLPIDRKAKRARSCVAGTPWNMLASSGLKRWTQSGAYGRDETGRLVLRIALGFACWIWASACLADPSATQNTPSNAAFPPLAPADFGLIKGLEIGVGSSDLSGDFGATKTTNIAAVLATVTYRIDNLRLTGSLPWMRIDSPGAVFTGIEGTPIIVDASRSGDKRLRQGLGDLTFGASYLLPAKLTYGIDTDVSFRIKVPTSSKGSDLSTGEVDYSLGGTLAKRIGNIAPLASVFYRNFGNSQQFQLKDGLATSIGAIYTFSPRVDALLTYDYAKRASHYISDSHQITGSITSLLPHTALRLTSFLSGGLSRGAPAISAGLALSLRL